MKEFDYFSWDDFLKAIKNRKVVLWGAGKTGIDAWVDLCRFCTISGMVDKSNNVIGKQIENCIVENVSKLEDENVDKLVVVITHQYLYAAIDELKRMNISYYFHYETMKFNKKTKRTFNFANDAICDYEWMKLMCYAHGMGMIDGICITNSLEAFKYNYQRGYRIFECDMMFLENGEVILCHSGDPIENVIQCEGDKLVKRIKNDVNYIGKNRGPISYVQLSKEKIFGRYTPMRFVDLLKLLRHDYPEAKIIPDVSHAGGCAKLARLMDLIEDYDPSLFSKFIFEVNVDEAEYIDYIKERARNSSIMFVHDHRQYIEKRYTDIELVEMCTKAHINLLMVGIPRISQHLIDVANEENVHIGAYCWINNAETINRLRTLGVSFFCTESQIVI